MIKSLAVFLLALEVNNLGLAENIHISQRLILIRQPTFFGTMICYVM